MQKINCLSDVDLKMSQVNVLLSEINQEMSSSLAPVQSSFLLLPRVQIILSEIKYSYIVSIFTRCDLIQKNTVSKPNRFFFDSQLHTF